MNKIEDGYELKELFFHYDGEAPRSAMIKVKKRVNYDFVFDTDTVPNTDSDQPTLEPVKAYLDKLNGVDLQPLEILNSRERIAFNDYIMEVDPSHFGTLTFWDKARSKDIDTALVELERFFERLHSRAFPHNKHKILPNRFVAEHHEDGSIHFHMVLNWDGDEDRLAKIWNLAVSKMKFIGIRGNCLQQIGTGKVIAGDRIADKYYIQNDAITPEHLKGEELYGYHQRKVADYMTKEHRSAIGGYRDGFRVGRATRDGLF